MHKGEDHMLGVALTDESTQVHCHLIITYSPISQQLINASFCDRPLKFGSNFIIVIHTFSWWNQFNRFLIHGFTKYKGIIKVNLLLRKNGSVWGNHKSIVCIILSLPVVCWENFEHSHSCKRKNCCDRLPFLEKRQKLWLGSVPFSDSKLTMDDISNLVQFRFKGEAHITNMWRVQNEFGTFQDNSTKDPILKCLIRGSPKYLQVTASIVFVGHLDSDKVLIMETLSIGDPFFTVKDFGWNLWNKCILVWDVALFKVWGFRPGHWDFLLVFWFHTRGGNIGLGTFTPGIPQNVKEGIVLPTIWDVVAEKFMLCQGVDALTCLRGRRTMWAH